MERGERHHEVGPSASDVALVQAVMAKRSALQGSEVEMAQSMAAQAARKPLSEKQRGWLGRVAKQIGAGVDAPAVDSRGGVVGTFGPLPLKPPGR